MHGMINRGLQCYIRDIHGVDVWEETCEQAKFPFYNFESMLMYDDATTESLLKCFGELVERSRDEILEDFGTYVVSEDALTAVRRLLKFGGDNYAEFLHSLNFVTARAQMAIPDLDIPLMEVVSKGPRKFILYSRFQKRGFGATLLGLLRALADDYNTLISIEHYRRTLKYVDEDVFTINLLQEGWFDTAHPALVQH